MDSEHLVAVNAVHYAIVNHPGLELEGEFERWEGADYAWIVDVDGRYTLAPYSVDREPGSWHYAH